MTDPTKSASVAVTQEALAAAIKATEYKYFGDYEMSDDQREAVDTLVEFAKQNAGSRLSAVPGGLDMDTLAKAIDPLAWSTPRNFDHGVTLSMRQGEAKQAADRILAILASIPPAEAVGARTTYQHFTDGMEAAAQICGSLAETTYDDSDAFEAATGCEAAIMRVVKEQRAQQKQGGEA